MCFLHPYQVPTVFISSDAIITYHVIRLITPYSHSLLKDRENFSEYEIKQNSTWRELFAIQLALQSFAPKISNKFICWETDSYASSLTVASESNNTGSPDLLGTQSHKTFKNIQSQSTLVVPFWHSASSQSFLQSYVSKESNSYVVDYKVFTHHISVFSWGIISLLNRFKPIQNSDFGMQSRFS